MTTKQLNIKNKTYHFYNNLKLDKKSWRDIDIYYIGYVDKDKPSEWRVNSVNRLYLIVNSRRQKCRRKKWCKIFENG